MPYPNYERPAVSNPCSKSIGLFARLRAHLVGLCFLLLPGLTLAAPFAYIPNADAISNNVSVIDTATNTVTATVAVGANPVGVAVNPAGTRVYVANAGSNNVSVIDTATNTVTATVAVGTSPFGVAVNPAGTRVYVANSGSDNVSVIDTATNTVTATVTVGTRPFALGHFIGPAVATPTTPATIPTMTEWGMILLSSLLALGTILILRRQHQ